MIVNNIFLRCPECGSKDVQYRGHKEMYAIDDGCRIKCMKCWRIGKVWQFKVREAVDYGGHGDAS